MSCSTPGGVEFSSTVGAVASPVPAVGVLPVDEVQALLDDLAPACTARWHGIDCASVGEWLVWSDCSLGDPTLTAVNCSAHLAAKYRGEITHRACVHAPLGRLIVTRSERIRSKPTK